MTLPRLILLLLISAWTSGCGAIDTCKVFAPINPSHKDVLTDGTKRQILVHDEVGARVCGWKP